MFLATFASNHSIYLYGRQTDSYAPLNEVYFAVYSQTQLVIWHGVIDVS